MEKDRAAQTELDLAKRLNQVKDLQSEKIELDKKNVFYAERMEALEKEVRNAKNETKEAKYESGDKEEGRLFPEL